MSTDTIGRNIISVPSPFGSPVKFKFRSATEGVASAEGLQVNGILHERMSYWFCLKPGQGEGGTPGYVKPYVWFHGDGGSFTLTRKGYGYNDATDNAKTKVREFCNAEALKLFNDPRIRAEGHRAKIKMYFDRAKGDVTELETKHILAVERLEELKHQMVKQNPFCQKEHSHYSQKYCIRPEGHLGSCDFGKS